MSEKWTKGPWHVEKILDDNGEPTGDFGVCHPETVCESTTIMNPQNEHDAHLIAAAPELYEALKDLMDPIIDRYSCQSSGRNKCLCRRCSEQLAEAALRKARGEATK